MMMMIMLKRTWYNSIKLMPEISKNEGNQLQKAEDTNNHCNISHRVNALKITLMKKEAEYISR
jgi:hypothetical protein